MSESDAMAAPQEQLEKGLRFLGFAVMINRLKADTADVIGHLQAANMRCAMITGYDRSFIILSLLHRPEGVHVELN